MPAVLAILRLAVLVKCVAAAVYQESAASMSAWNCTPGQSPDLTFPIQAMACGSGSAKPDCHDASTGKGFGFFALDLGEDRFPCIHRVPKT